MLITQSREAEAKQLADVSTLPVLLEPGNPFALRPKALIPAQITEERVAIEQAVTEVSSSRVAQQVDNLQERKVKAALANVARYPDRGEVLNNAGLALLNAGRIADAEQYFVQALERAPQLLQARANLAKAYSLSNRHEEALRIYEEIIREDSNNITALMNIAQIFTIQKKFLDAEAKLTQVVKLSKNSAAGWHNLGLSKLAQRRIDEAIGDLRKATRVAVREPSPHNSLGVAYALKGSHKKAIRAFKTALAIDPLNENATRNLARLLLESGAEDLAFDLLDSYLAHAEEDLEARNMLGRACFLLERTDLGMRHLRKALRTAEARKDTKEVAMLLNNLGVLAKTKGDLSEAREFYDQAIEKIPQALLPHQNLVGLLLDQGYLDSAQAQLDECFRIKEEDSQNFFLMGSLLARREKYEESLKWFQNAINSDPRNFRAYGGLTIVLGDVFGRFREVINLLQDVVKYNPNEKTMLNNLAYAYLMVDDVRAARRILDRLDPKRDNLFLTATRGLLLLREGNIHGGRRWYNLAAGMARTKDLRNLVEQKKHLELARYYVSQGRPQEAKSHLLAGRSLKTSHSYYRIGIEQLLQSMATDKTS